MEPRPLILKTELSPGDLCTLTAALESLHNMHPSKYLTDVRTSCDELFLHNPRVTALSDQSAEIVGMHYDLIVNCDAIPNPFIRGYCDYLGKYLGIPLDLTTNRPHLYLSREEKKTHPLKKLFNGSSPHYWLVNAGIKRDFTLKQWPVEYYQEVINHFKGKIQFVQVGSDEHDHPHLDGVIHLVGRTSIRELMVLAYHADAGLGPITLLQHFCAAFEKPYVAILGGREPVSWTQYPLQTTLHTLGKLPCCQFRSCWRSRVVRLNDGSEQDRNLCESPVLGLQRPVGKCMAIIKPVEVIRAIEAFYEGGSLSFEESSTTEFQAPLKLTMETKASHDAAPSDDLTLIAHSGWGFHVQIVPAFTARDWMDQTGQGYAYHCLPMVMANQSGWFVLAPHDVMAEWNGGSGIADLAVTVSGDLRSIQAVSSVGSGILTWTIPYVFRTPPGWNLLCRGPANYGKDGIFPLEGLVETDWSFASFSMNWKFTRPGRCEFKKGEPIAMLVPHRRRDLELFRPGFAHLQDNPELEQGYSLWIRSREEFWEGQRQRDPDVLRKKFQKHYYRGCTNQGIEFPDHQKSRNLATFAAAPETRGDSAIGEKPARSNRVMKIRADKPYFVLVTGMARSGTTFLASVLNSAENAVILSEPHNSIRKHRFVRADKLGAPGEKRTISVDEIIPWVKGSGRLITGVKEVCEFTPERDCRFLDYAVDPADLILVIIRDPVETIASQNAVIRFTLAQSLLIMANFMEWVSIQRTRRKVKFIRYDWLCAKPKEYLNSVLHPELCIEGEFVKRPMQGFGDGRALSSEVVKAANSRRQQLSPSEIAAIEAVAAGWFDDLGFDRIPTETEVKSRATVAQQRHFNYVRVGHDERPVELLEGGAVGQGRARCEDQWTVREELDGQLTLVISGRGRTTCRLKPSADGIWRGRWISFEKMPIELIPRVMAP